LSIDKRAEPHRGLPQDAEAACIAVYRRMQKSACAVYRLDESISAVDRGNALSDSV
jgi:hypothetical protein